MGGETSEMSSLLDIVIFADLFVLCVVAVVLLRTLMSRRNPSGTSARVKRPFTLLLLILVISLSTFAYAATQVNVSNTGNITTGYNLLIASPSCAAGAFSSGGMGGNVCEFPSGTSCGPTSGNYIDSALCNQRLVASTRRFIHNPCLPRKHWNRRTHSEHQRKCPAYRTHIHIRSRWTVSLGWCIHVGRHDIHRESNNLNGKRPKLR